MGKKKMIGCVFFIMDKIHIVFSPKMFKSRVEQETKEWNYFLQTEYISP